jgi:Fe-S cluster assembly protein SufD
MIAVKENQDLYVSHFSSLAEKQRWPWLVNLRRDAFARFLDLGFPTTKNEEWKYTNVSGIAKVPFQRAGGDASSLTREKLEELSFAGPVSARIVFVNGRHAPRLSFPGALPNNVRVMSLAEALESGIEAVENHLARYASFEDQAFVALNTALLEDGMFVEVPRGLVLSAPIHLLYVTTAGETPTVSHPRALIIAERESQAAVVEEHVGLGSGVYFTNAVTEIVTAEGSVLQHYKLQRENLDAFHVATVQANQDRASHFLSHSVSIGGRLVRNDIQTLLDAEGGECTLNGLFLGDGGQHVDHHTLLDHAKPRCMSREFYRGILGGKSAGVFNGKIIVRKDAQKTDAIQSNKNLLLSENAVINTKPQLEIFADDVRCTHGATVGQLDEEALFYLRSRGLGNEQARSLLIRAFAQNILDRMKLESIRDKLSSLLLHGLEAA